MKSKPVNYFKITLPAYSVNESFARCIVSNFIAPLDPTIDELTDIRTAVSEAVTNCIVHAYKKNEGKVYITGEYFGDKTVVIKIKDKGCGIENLEQAMQPLFTTDTTGERGGMGFAIMKTFTDKFKVKSIVGKGTEITLCKHLSSDE